MPKQKKSLTKEEKLAKDRLRKKEKYLELKQNPELYAIQKEKERKRYLLRKEQKKICSIKELTPRNQREQRKRWRRNARNYLKRQEQKRKIDQILVENSPPMSEVDEQNNEHEVNEPDPLQVVENENIQNAVNPSSIHRQPAQSSAALRKMRYRHQKIVKRLQGEIDKLRKEKKYLLRKSSVQNKQKCKEDSIEKKVNDLIETGRVEDVKKKLIFAETLTQDMKHGYDSQKKKEKQNFAKNMMHNKDRMKKYKVLKNMPFRLRKTLPQQTTNRLKNDIELFFEEDTNSRVAAGKNEYIKRKGITKQKRYITDNLKNLHDKFLKEQYYLSYSSFCKYRPYWVVFPNNTRDTCLCKLHCNVDLIMNALKKEKVVKQGSGTEMMKKLCCDYSNDRCVQRKCDTCKNKVLDYTEFSNENKIIYHQWMIEKEKYKDRNGTEKLKTISTKKRLEDNPRNIILKLHDLQDTYLQHCHNIVKQYLKIKHLKENFKRDEILIHVDFSENYAYKFNEEIQSFHFGGSRGQASLHTGVIYYLDGQTQFVIAKSFCTMSENLNHDAGAIWAHLTPILKIAQDLVPSLKTIHFLSDSPSSQYRNRYIFNMTTKLKEQVVTLEKITWNYQEAGHGKGAPDGVGAVVKRTADNFVKFGGDVGSFQKFVEVISQKIQNIHFEIVSEDEVAKKRWPHKIPSFKGTMKVHQVVWCQSLPGRIALRSLSCFTCRDDVPCSHYHLGNIHYAASHTNYDDTLRIDSPTLANNVRDLGAVEDEIFDNLPIPSPTGHLANNVDDLGAVEDEIKFDDLPIPLSTSHDSNKKPKSPVVKILSNVRFDWQNTSFYNKPSTTFNPHDQSDFMKFIQRRAENPEHENVKQSTFVKINDIEPSNKENDNSVTNQPSQESPMEVDDVNTKITLKNFAIMQYPEHKNVKPSTSVKIDDIEHSNKENDNSVVNQPTQESPMEVDDVNTKFNLNNWVIVQYQIKSKIFSYIGKITASCDEIHTIMFLKKAQGKYLKFYWPDVSDEDSLPDSRILMLLEDPIINRRGQYVFKNLPEYDYK